MRQVLRICNVYSTLSEHKVRIPGVILVIIKFIVAVGGNAKMTELE